MTVALISVPACSQSPTPSDHALQKASRLFGPAVLRGMAYLAAAVTSIIALSVALPPSPAAGAVLYRCTDESGASVFTDNPAQLTRCEVMEPGAVAEAERRAASRPAPPPIADEPIAELPPSEGDENEANDKVTVSVERLGHLLIVSTQINGDRDARLILDTGASHTILSRAVSDDLGLLADSSARAVTLKTAGGSVEAVIVRLDSIRVAGAEVRNSLVAVYDMPDAPPGVDGLLGLTFLSQFEVTLDTARGVLHLRRPRR